MATRRGSRACWRTSSALTSVGIPPTMATGCSDSWSAIFNGSFLAEAVMDDDKHYERKRVVFVAPHQAGVELRSG
jgi:hypothetical protein